MHFWNVSYNLCLKKILIYKKKNMCVREREITIVLL